MTLSNTVNPWSNYNPQLGVVLPEVWGFLQDPDPENNSIKLTSEYLNLHKVCRAWDRIFTEHLNKQRPSVMIQFIKRHEEAYRDEVREIRDFEDFATDHCFTRTYFCSLAGGFAGLICVAVLTAVIGGNGGAPHKSPEELMHLLAESAWEQLPENGSTALGFTLDFVKESLTRFMFVNESLGNTEICNETVQECWNTLFSGANLDNETAYIMRPFTMDDIHPKLWLPTTDYQIFFPLALAIGFPLYSALWSVVDYPIHRCYQRTITAERYTEVNHIFETALDRFSHIKSLQPNIQESRAVIKPIPPAFPTTNRTHCLSVIKSLGYTFSVALILHGVLEAFREAVEGDYTEYTDAYWDPNVTLSDDPCFNSDDIGLAFVENCTRLLLNTTEFWDTYAHRAVLDKETFIKEIMLPVQITAGVFGGYFLLERYIAWIKIAKESRLAKSILHQAQSFKQTCSNGFSWLTRKIYRIRASEEEVELLDLERA